MKRRLRLQRHHSRVPPSYPKSSSLFPYLLSLPLPSLSCSLSPLPSSQVPSVERVASYLKNHKDSKVTIKGYASKDGPQDLNIKLANKRAEAVKDMLVKKYGISESRISASGNGISEMFSEAEWNRVSICTMDK